MINRFVSDFKETGSYHVKIVIQGVKYNIYCNHIPHVSAWGHYGLEVFAKVFGLCKNLYNQLIVSLRLVYFWIVEKFLENQVHNLLAYFASDAFEFVHISFGSSNSMILKAILLFTPSVIMY